MQIGIFGILGLIFVTLKLCGVIGWSWWWVLAPFYAGFAIVASLFIAAVVVAIIANGGRYPWDRS